MARVLATMRLSIPYLTCIHLFVHTAYNKHLAISGYMAMAKAHIKRPDGTSIVIEGTPQEVTELVSKLEASAPSKGKMAKLTEKRGNRGKVTLSDSLLLLVDEGFFKKPKELGTVKAALAERGHVYPVTTLSPALLRLVQRRYLRRIKQDSRWFYTG